MSASIRLPPPGGARVPQYCRSDPPADSLGSLKSHLISGSVLLRESRQPAGFPSICPVDLLIVLIKETRMRRRSDTSVGLWGSCLRGSLLQMGDRGGDSQACVPVGTIWPNRDVYELMYWCEWMLKKGLPVPFLLVYIFLEPLLLLLLHSHALVPHFLRSWPTVHGVVNMAWLFFCSGKSSQTQTCRRTKSPCGVRPWACKHNSTTSPPLRSPRFRCPFFLLGLLTLALLTQTLVPFCSGAFLCLSPPLHLLSFHPSSSPFKPCWLRCVEGTLTEERGKEGCG